MVTLIHLYSLDKEFLIKALERTWSKLNKLSGVILCEDGMHLLMCVSAAVGWLYGDTGLRNLLIDSEVFASGTVQLILLGKDFDRGLYAFILVDEFLNNQFYKILEHGVMEVRKCPRRFSYKHRGITNDQITLQQRVEVIDKLEIILEEVIMRLIDEFCKEGINLYSTFKFWVDDLKRVPLPLKTFITAPSHGK